MAGEDYLRNGYELEPAHDPYEPLFLEKLEYLLGFRLNITPIMLETNSLLEDSSQVDKTTRVTLGNANWIQFFVAGPVWNHVSFFSELEYAKSSFKFNWFYFNFTRLAQSTGLNFQLGSISPLEFASFPNRLPQLPALKGEVMLVKSSDGKGEESVDMSSARPGVQYYGYNDWILAYAGLSPGTSAVDVNQFLQYWGGLVFRLPSGAAEGFEGSSATIHYYGGTDTKGTGTASQVENSFTRISPQVCIRYQGKLDVQAAYVIAEDDNRALVANPTSSFKYKGVAAEAGYMPTSEWHLAVHYDNFESDDLIMGTSTPVIEYHRIVPAVTYLIPNENLRFTLYYEKELRDIPVKVDKLSINMRAMF
jgi:hypothetical protein